MEIAFNSIEKESVLTIYPNAYCMDRSKHISTNMTNRIFARFYIMLDNGKILASSAESEKHAWKWASIIINRNIIRLLER